MELFESMRDYLIKKSGILIDTVLDLSRLESKKVPVEFKDEDIEELIEASLNAVSVLAKRNNVDLSRQYDADTEAIYTDKNLLFRILINLLTNAIKVSGADSIVSVRAFSPDAQHIAISVADQGPGIPKAIARKMFNKFMQIKARESGIIFGCNDPRSAYYPVPLLFRVKERRVIKKICEDESRKRANCAEITVKDPVPI